MSRGTLGTFLGAGIGFLIGGPVGAQVGALIGGAVGSSFDTIPGRKVGEMSSPRAQEGEPIPLVFGSARVTGRLMSCGEPDIRTESEGGKGGPKVENETAYLSYSILVCESSELRDSSIAGILMVIENNKIVYDVRPVPAISGADSAKWATNKRFYLGGEGQGVDSTEQMIHGAGNVPAYRGLCRMVVTDEDVTQHGGAIPTYEFVTSQCGVDEAFDGKLLVTGSAKTVGGPLYCEIVTDGPLAGIGIEQSTGANASGAATYYDGQWVVANATDGLRVSVDDRETWTSIALPTFPYSGTVNNIYGGPNGWLIWGGYWAEDEHAYAGNLSGPWTVITTGISNGISFADGKYWKCWDGLYSAIYPDGPWVMVTPSPAPWGSPYSWRDIVEHDGDLYACCLYTEGYHYPTQYSTVSRSTDNGVTWEVIVASNVTGYAPYQLASTGEHLVAYCANGGGNNVVYTSANGWSSAVSTGITHSDGRTGGFAIRTRKIAAYNGSVYVIGDGDVIAKSSDGGLTWGAPATLPIQETISIVAPSEGYIPPEGAIELPDAPGHYYDPSTGGTSGPTEAVDTCPPITLQEIIDKLDARAGIPTANSVTDELADIEVPGYAIDQFVTVAEAKEPLRQVWFFDCPEWDDAIRYRLRGQATDFTIDPDDLIEGEDATESGTRGQTVEYPKRLHVQYVDPVTGYKPMKQTAERISPDIRVKGEMVTGANITLSADTAKRAADIGLKTAWTEREDSREFAIPVDYWPQAIAAHTFALDSRRYRITELRLEAGAIYIKSVYDRLSAYGSNATGTVGPSPTAPPSNIIGPTDFAVMNLPALRDADDSPGLYYAARGYTEGWTGARLQMVRNFLWNTVANITTACVMGELLAELPVADRDVIDTTNTISVRVSGTLDSVTFDDLLNESNVLAVLYPDYTAEILQFQTATEISPGVYDLTTLIRGRLDTVIDTHAIGAQVVLLNSAIRFFELNTTELDQPTLQFRNVANGLAESTATTLTLTNTQIESVREWPVSDIEWERDGSDNLIVTWIGRARLGTDAVPVHSRYFTGYLVTITDGTTTRSWNTTLQSFVVSSADQVSIFGSNSFTPTITVTPTSTVTGGEIGNGAAFPVGLAGWASDQAGWSEVAGAAVYDPTVSGVAQSYLRMTTPVPLPYTDPPALFYAACDVAATGASGGAVGYEYYLGGVSTARFGTGTQNHPHSTVTASPSPYADAIAPAIYANTDGTSSVSFTNIAYSVSE